VNKNEIKSLQDHYKKIKERAMENEFRKRVKATVMIDFTRLSSK
jgi:hypothetical protein